MIIVKRDIDDGYGKVHTVQRETFQNLEAFLKLVREDCKLDIPPITASDDLEGYLCKHRLSGRLCKWIVQNLAQKHVHLDLIGTLKDMGTRRMCGRFGRNTRWSQATGDESFPHPVEALISAFI